MKCFAVVSASHMILTDTIKGLNALKSFLSTQIYSAARALDGTADSAHAYDRLHDGVMALYYIAATTTQVLRQYGMHE